MAAGWLYCSSTRQKVKDKNDDGQNEQDMDPSAEGVTADESYDPEDEEDNSDCPEHFVVLLMCATLTGLPNTQMKFRASQPSCGKVPCAPEWLPQMRK